MKIVSADYMYFAPEHLEELSKLGDFVRHNDFPKGKRKLLERIKDAEVIINFWFSMDKDLFDKLPDLKMVCVAAAGYDWIDIKEARKRGVVVSNCPGHNTESVAENTIALMLASVRNILPSSESVKKGEWNPIGFKGVDLKDKTLGVVGYGRIGKRVAEIASKGFGMKILSVDSKSSRKDLKNLLMNSDFISVNAPLNEKTKGMIAGREFDLMKDGVVIVNTGRGAVIDEGSLVKNLKNGKIRAAGLDTYTQEPPKKKIPMLKFDNVVCTPHISWDTEETDFYLAQMVVDNVKAFIKGKPINNVA